MPKHSGSFRRDFVNAPPEILEILYNKEKQDLFLHTLANTAMVVRAAQATGIDKWHWYDLRETDKSFRDRWNDAYARATESIEDEAVRRATEGWDVPVYYLGQTVGSIKHYSDSLLMQQLKARKPGKYSERQSIAITETSAATTDAALFAIATTGGSNGSDEETGQEEF